MLAFVFKILISKNYLKGITLRFSGARLFARPTASALLDEAAARQKKNLK